MGYKEDRQIEKLRRSFLWKGTTGAGGGHSLVRWCHTMKPKKFGGLGIMDLDLFGRALRLRWLWYQWVELERSWVGSKPPVTALDKQLFRASTTVSVGNGETTSFWQSSWLNGQAPMDIYPDLFRFAWRKNKSVKEELHKQNWTRELWRMETVSEMASFVAQWDRVQGLQLTREPDQIKRDWTTDGLYTAKSAYVAQFHGTYSTFEGDHIWKAEAEGKHKFFAWLLVQSRILTADNLMARQWHCNPAYTLCNLELETSPHLILHCNFARQVWDKMAAWTAGLIQVPDQGGEIMDWWQKELAHLPRKTRRLKAAMLMYGAWNIWKARNGLFFYQKITTPREVLQEIKAEVATRKMACGKPELSDFHV